MNWPGRLTGPVGHQDGILGTALGAVDVAPDQEGIIGQGLRGGAKRDIDIKLGYVTGELLHSSQILYWQGHFRVGWGMYVEVRSMGSLQ